MMVVTRGRGAKAKGNAAEREVAELIKEHFPKAQVQRMPLSGAVKGFDGDIANDLGLVIEVKRQERLNIWASWAQAKAAAEGLFSRLPVLFFRKNNSEWLTVLSLKNFCELYSELLELRETKEQK